MKVYLSGPMEGHPDLNFREFHHYATRLRAEGHEVFSPAEAPTPQDNRRACLATDLDWICREADIIAMMPGWTQSRGAIAELATARALPIQEMYLPDFQPMWPSESPFLLEPQCLAISRSHSPQLLASLLRAKNSTRLVGGTDPSRKITPMLLFAIILSAAVSIPMASLTLLKWLGAR